MVLQVKTILHKGIVNSEYLHQHRRQALFTTGKMVGFRLQKLLYFITASFFVATGFSSTTSEYR